MKILLLDIETAPNIVRTWGLWNVNVGLSQIISPGYTLCWSARWLGSKETMFSSIIDDGPVEMIKKIHSLLDEADVVIGYNSNKFDLPILNKDFIEHGLTPPAPYKRIDLLRTVRTNFKFTSNKLDFVCQFLGLGAKTQHKGQELWNECVAGDVKAWKMMEKYNRQDVALLEKLYHKLLPWISNHPNRALYSGDGRPACPNCGSSKVQSRGYCYAATYTYRRYRCNYCGKWSKSRVAEKGLSLPTIVAV